MLYYCNCNYNTKRLLENAVEYNMQYSSVFIEIYQVAEYYGCQRNLSSRLLRWSHEGRRPRRGAQMRSCSEFWGYPRWPTRAHSLHNHVVEMSQEKFAFRPQRMWLRVYCRQTDYRAIRFSSIAFLLALGDMRMNKRSRMPRWSIYIVSTSQVGWVYTPGG